MNRNSANYFERIITINKNYNNYVMNKNSANYFEKTVTIKQEL